MKTCWNMTVELKTQNTPLGDSPLELHLFLLRPDWQNMILNFRIHSRKKDLAVYFLCYLCFDIQPTLILCLNSAQITLCTKSKKVELLISLIQVHGVLITDKGIH